MKDFTRFLQQGGLGDLGFNGSMFTWCNNHDNMDNRVWARLDRFVACGDFVNKFPQFAVHLIPRVESVHSPIVLSVGEREKGK